MKRSKILVVSKQKSDVDMIERALSFFLKEGGEFLATDDEEKGIEILLCEKPALLFLDEGCMESHQEQWIQPHTHTVLIVEGNEQESEEFLRRPLNTQQLLAKCQVVFPEFDAPPVIPM